MYLDLMLKNWIEVHDQSRELYNINNLTNLKVLKHICLDQTYVIILMLALL